MPSARKRPPPYLYRIAAYGGDSFRYALGRTWDRDLPLVNFIMLNPSTANATEDDATVRRCVAFARSWGFGELAITNLFAFRATQPAVMEKAPDPYGPDNAFWQSDVARTAELVVCAWGALEFAFEPGLVLGRRLQKERINLHCIATTQSGAPAHPLYLKRDLKPVPWGKGLL